MKKKTSPSCWYEARWRLFNPSRLQIKYLLGALKLNLIFLIFLHSGLVEEQKRSQFGLNNLWLPQRRLETVSPFREKCP